jgi:hypothetical protein
MIFQFLRALCFLFFVVFIFYLFFVFCFLFFVFCFLFFVFCFLFFAFYRTVRATCYPKKLPQRHTLLCCCCFASTVAPELSLRHASLQQAGRRQEEEELSPTLSKAQHGTAHSPSRPHCTAPLHCTTDWLNAAIVAQYSY